VEIPEPRWVRTDDGVDIAYQAFGSGMLDVVFLTGLSSNLDMMWTDPGYDRFLRRLSTLGRVIAIDRRGTGLSERLSPEDLPPIEVVAEDTGAVLDTLDSSEAVLIGFDDAGGQLAALFAAAHPDRVRGLVLIGSRATPLADDDAPWGDDPQEWERWFVWMRQHWGSRESALHDIRQFAPTRAADEAYVRWVALIQRNSHSPAACEAIYRIAVLTDVRDILPAISVPTLILHRTNDSQISIEAGRYLQGAIPGARLVELPGIDHGIFEGPQEEVFEALGGFLNELSIGGARPSIPRRLATILFTDIVGSTARSAELGDDAWKQVLESHHRVLREAIERHGGREISTAGDGFFATFDGPAAGARCAIEATANVRALGLEIRAGVHTGEVETIDAEIGGIGVTIGARIGALAGPSEVLVSSTVKDLTAGSGLRFEDAGEHDLKGVPERWRLYRVVD